MAFNFGALKGVKKFDVNTEGLSYRSLADLYNQYGEDYVYRVRAIFINKKNKFGDTPILCVSIENEEKFLIDLPKHTLDVCNTILDSPEAVEAINGGECGIKIHTYYSKSYNKDCFSVNFCDVTPF